MAIVSTQQEQVVIRFTVTEGDLSYTDALYFTPTEYAATTPEQIMAMQQARFDNWKAVVTAPPAPPVEMTPDEVQAKIAALITEQHAIKDQLLAITPDDQMIVLLEQQAVRIADELAVLQAES